MKIKYFVLMIFFISLKYSYPVEISVYHYEFNENADTYIFGDNVRVRKTPELQDANVADKLNIGDKVTILKKTDKSMVSDGYRENWYQISYIKDNKKFIGYIWGGLLSFAYSVQGDKLFLAGIKKYSNRSSFISECRLVVAGKILSSVEFEPHYLNDGNNEGAYGYAVASELGDAKGLEGLENIFRIHFNYEACGYPRGNIWIGYGRNRLYYIGKDTSVSEAGVFQVEEKYFFHPEKSTEKNSVILLHEEYAFDENTSDYKLTDKKETRFLWNNYKLIPAK